MHAVPLTIRRALAVATRTPDREGDLGVGGKRRVAKTLPRGAKAEHVYEVVMDESAFVSGLEVNDLLADPNVIGVFERHVPLVECAVQTLGCVATVDRNRAGSLVDAGGSYDASKLEMRTTAECGYLPLAPRRAAGEGGSGSSSGANAAAHGMLRHVTVYHAGSKDKGVYALHTPATGAATLVIVAPGAFTANGRQRPANANGERQVTSATLERRGGSGGARVFELGAEDEEEEDVNDREAIAWTVEYVKDDRDAGAAVSRHLSAYLEDPKGPTLCLLEAAPTAGLDPDAAASDPSSDVSSSSPASHRAGVAGRVGALIPALARLPVIAIPANLADGASMPTLGWQVGAARTAASRVDAASDWLARRVAVARYAHVPLGSLGQDWCLHTADVFSRARSAITTSSSGRARAARRTSAAARATSR